LLLLNLLEEHARGRMVGVNLQGEAKGDPSAVILVTENLNLGAGCELLDVLETGDFQPDANGAVVRSERRSLTIGPPSCFPIAGAFRDEALSIKTIDASILILRRLSARRRGLREYDERERGGKRQRKERPANMTEQRIQHAKGQVKAGRKV
jgi:hypothetical protein